MAHSCTHHHNQNANNDNQDADCYSYSNVGSFHFCEAGWLSWSVLAFCRNFFDL